MARLLIVVLAFVLGLYGLAQGDILGLLYLSVSLLLVWGYFRYGSVWLAFRAYQNGDILKMKKHLQATKHPTYLNAQARAYFDMLRGVALADDERLEESYSLLLAASQGELRTSNIRSAVEIHLADVSIQMGNLEFAARHVAQARELEHRPELDPFIDTLEQRITGAV